MTLTQEVGEIKDCAGDVVYEGRYVSAEEALDLTCGHHYIARVFMPLPEYLPDLPDLSPIDRTFLVGAAAQEFRRMSETERCPKCGDGAEDEGR